MFHVECSESYGETFDLECPVCSLNEYLDEEDNSDPVKEISEKKAGVDMVESFGCKHYRRKCEIQAPCCEIWYGCRFCHNEEYKGPDGPGCQVQQMNRSEVKRVRCLICNSEQSPSKHCGTCGIEFGRYYCEKCVFYDDTEGKDIFHCDDCGMCRLGPKEEFKHCFACCVCISIQVKKHRCSALKGQNCPVCQDSLLESTTPLTQLKYCGHYIHEKCLNENKASFDNKCPTCGLLQCEPDKAN